MFQNRSDAGYESMGSPQEHTSADIQISRVGVFKVLLNFNSNRNSKTVKLT